MNSSIQIHMSSSSGKNATVLQDRKNVKCALAHKPAIHYSQTRRTGDETIFLPNKIFFVKTGRTCYYTSFVVRCQFLHEHIRHWEFFLTKNSFVFIEETATSTQNPANSVRWKTCLQNMANTYYTLFALSHFFIISPLFRRCLRIVYSGL